MRTFAEKPKKTQPTASAKASSVSRAHVGQGHDPNSILYLQRTIGNQAVNRLLQANATELEGGRANTTTPHFGHEFSRIPITPPKAGAIQTKLAINKPGDEYEQEADSVAEQVMHRPELRLQPDRSRGGSCPNCQTGQAHPPYERLQTQRVQVSNIGHFAVPHVMHEVLQSPGQPLNPNTRAFMEPRFGHDFGRVRIHADARAGDSAAAFQARAYTFGSQIVFGRDQYEPGTSEGQRLLAHELTHVVQQTSNVRTQGPGSSLIVTCRSEPALARTPLKTATIPAMTPEDMWNKIIAARGFEEAIPVHQLEATKARLDVMEAQLKKNPSPPLQHDYRNLLNRYNLSKLGSPGGAAGGGFNTFALIQVVDQNGNIVGTAMGKYTGGDHAEEIAVAQLRKQLTGQKLAGGRIEVVGDKVICSKRCAPALTQFAKDIEVDRVEGHVFTREKIVGAGEATEKTTARTATKASSEGKPLTRRSEVVYARSGSAPGPARPPVQGAGTPAKAPAGGGTSAKPATRAPSIPKPVPAPAVKPEAGALRPRTSAAPKAEPSPAPRTRGRATLSGGQVSISSGGAWSLAGKVGTGASGALSVWGTISTIDGALAQIEKAQSGSVAPQVATAIKAVEKNFPTASELRADLLWYWGDREKDYSRATAWLHNNGVNALMTKGANLDRMGQELDYALRYSEDYEKLGEELRQKSDNIAPLLTELKKRTGVLHDIVDDLEKVMPYLPSDTAQLTIWGVRTEFWNAAQDLGKLESLVSTRKWIYDRDYEDAQQKRRTAAVVFNFWAPAFAKIWKEQTGKTVAPTSLPIE